MQFSPSLASSPLFLSSPPTDWAAWAIPLLDECSFLLASPLLGPTFSIPHPKPGWAGFFLLLRDPPPFPGIFSEVLSVKQGNTERTKSWLGPPALLQTEELGLPVLASSHAGSLGRRKYSSPPCQSVSSIRGWAHPGQSVPPPKVCSRRFVLRTDPSTTALPPLPTKPQAPKIRPGIGSGWVRDRLFKNYFSHIWGGIYPPSPFVSDCQNLSNPLPLLVADFYEQSLIVTTTLIAAIATKVLIARI